jgi:hypothetical protein
MTFSCTVQCGWSGLVADWTDTSIPHYLDPQQWPFSEQSATHKPVCPRCGKDLLMHVIDVRREP